MTLRWTPNERAAISKWRKRSTTFRAGHCPFRNLDEDDLPCEKCREIFEVEHECFWCPCDNLTEPEVFRLSKEMI
jgi:hypothetical protein